MVDLILPERRTDGVTPADAAAVLYLDHDGGFGGSGRSLRFLVESLPQGAVRPVLVARREGPTIARLRALGVPVLVEPALPTYRPGERKALAGYLHYLWSRRRWPKVRRRIVAFAQANGIRLIHVNHENMALIGSDLARVLGVPWVAHVRTQLHEGPFARRIARVIAASARRIVFISEPVADHFDTLAGRGWDRDKGRILYNMVPDDLDRAVPLDQLSAPAGHFRVLSLSNFSPNRGVDRVVDVADALARRGARDFLFFMCGRPAHRHLLPFVRNRYLDDIKQRIAALGLEAMFVFPGHVAAPERALASADVLIKLTRQSNPWGRDVMEALAAGLPVVTLGTYQTFVEHGVNGYVEPTFDAARVADFLVRLKGDPALAAKMRHANRKKAAALFSGARQARKIAAIYAEVL